MHTRKSRLPSRRTISPASTTTHSPSVSNSDARSGEILYLQRTIGNQAVQRYLEKFSVSHTTDTPFSGTLSRRTETSPTITTAKPNLLQRSWGNEKLDSRVEPQKMDAVTDGCGVKKRKVDYDTQKKKPTNPYGATASKLIIEYAVDSDGKVTLGCIRPEFKITIYSPYVTSDEFVEKFTPLMEMLWDKYKGDVGAFGKDHLVQNFNYYDQTMRHEEMHVNARNLAIVDLLPRYKRYLNDVKGLEKGETYFLEKTDFFWASGWDSETEAKISHERIHELDAINMVEEYQRRVGTEKPKPSLMENVLNYFGF